MKMQDYLLAWMEAMTGHSASVWSLMPARLLTPLCIYALLYHIFRLVALTLKCASHSTRQYIEAQIGGLGCTAPDFQGWERGLGSFIVNPSSGGVDESHESLNSTWGTSP